MVNIFLFLVMGFTFLFVMSYCRSPRPEKAMLGMLDRFFRSAEFLMSRTGAAPPACRSSTRWRSRSTSVSCVHSGAARGVGQGRSTDAVSRQTPERFRPWSSASGPGLSDRAISGGGGSCPEAALVLEARDESRSGTRASRTSSADGRGIPRPSRLPAHRAAGVSLVRLETRFVKVLDRGRTRSGRRCRRRFFRLLGGYRGFVGSGPRLRRGRADYPLVPIA